MTDLILYSKPFDWNDNLSEEAIEDFETIRGKLTYCQHQSIGMALAKLELLEKQGCKVIDSSVSSSEKPKTGHWIVNEWGNISCSECGCTALYDKVYPGESVFGKAIRIKTTFCPTCGAKMVEPQERSDKE